MAERTYRKLPINADEGFPQSFRLRFNDRMYQILLYANVSEEVAGGQEDVVYDLPTPGAFLVMRVARESGEGPAVIFQRKLVSDLEYEAAELAFVFREMRVAKRNLNGVGAFGSRVIGGIAARWAS